MKRPKTFSFKWKWALPVLFFFRNLLRLFFLSGLSLFRKLPKLPFSQWRRGLRKLFSFKLKNFSRYKARPGVAGLWKEEKDFLQAVREIYKGGKIRPVSITPYPVHGLEEATRTPRSWIPWLALVFGFVGCAFGVWFTWWASAVSWPLIVGGKPMWSLAAFIPVIFELTILFSAFGAIGSLVWACGLPHIGPPVIDKDLTSHKFALFVPEADCSGEKARAIFTAVKAPEIKDTEF